MLLPFAGKMLSSPKNNCHFQAKASQQKIFVRNHLSLPQARLSNKFKQLKGNCLVVHTFA